MPRWRPAALLVLALLLSGCVYRIDIEQGNLLDRDAMEQIEEGMTRSQVRFLLGTPVLRDAFNEERWDYVYYFRQGRTREVFHRRYIIWFDEDDRVTRIEDDVPMEPRRAGLFE